jgi:hypothetical protein
VVVAAEAGYPPADECVRGLVHQHRHGRLQQAHLHAQRPLREQSGEGADGGVEAGDDVRHRHPHLVGSVVPVTDIRPLRACAMTS